MKRILFIVLFIAAICLKAQTTFWTEGFGTGCNQLQLANGLNPSTNGTWTVSILGAEDPQANTWYVSATENGNAVGACGTGCGTNQTLHVASIPNGSGLTLCATGDCGASYDAGGSSSFGGTSTGTNKRVESPVINCTGHSTITLSFKYMENGQGATDNANLWYFDGTTWTQINGLAKTVTCSSGQGTWTAFSMVLPASANNNVNVKIGFLWVNDDDGAGTDPSFAVDDVTLTDAATAANPVVTITPSPTTAICQNATLTLNGSATNGPITAWAWTVNPKGGVVFNPDTTAQNPTVTFTSSGIYTFTLQATNASGSGISTQTVSVLASVTPLVTIVANPGNPICAGQAVSFTATTTNGGTTPIYQWQVNGTNAGTNSPNFSSSTLLNNDVVSVTFTSNATCASPINATANYTIQVTTAQTPSVVITPNPASACAGGLITFTAMPTNGGSIPVYQWQVNGVNAGTNASTFTLSAIAGQQVDVVLTSNAGCITASTAHSNTVTVTISPTPTLSIIHGNATVCPTSPATVVVSGSAGSTFSWTPSAGLNVTNNDTVIATNAALGIYTYHVICSLGTCTTTASVNITVASNFTISTTTSPTICPKQAAYLSVTGGSAWTWTPATNLSCTTCQHPIATPSTTTVYTVTATNGGCTSIATQTVVVSPSATALFGISGITVGVPQSLNFINASLNANGYIWNFGDNSGTVIQTNPSHIYNAAGTYTVMLIAFSANGCNDTINTQLILTDTAGLTMPNIFTPNGDGINDYFIPNAHGLKTLECTIYDRWGAKITTLDTSTQQYWDGHTTSGLACTDGTYFYTLTATDVNGKSYSLKGFIQLIR